jgi:hypothetical protein
MHFKLSYARYKELLAAARIANGNPTLIPPAPYSKNQEAPESEASFLVHKPVTLQQPSPSKIQ